MPDRRPNIVIFNPDQWRGDTLGHLGHPAVLTPNLDRMVAADSVSFARAFCQNPVCTPSRCSFMTGWYPHTAGHRTMFHMLHRHEPVLLKKLKDAGYFVWWGGKNDLVPGQHPVDDYCDVHHQPNERWPKPDPACWRGQPGGDSYYSFFGGRLDARGEPFFHDHDWSCVTAAIELLRDPPRDRPMCIYLPLINPHPTYTVEEPYFSLTDRAKVPERIATPDWSGWPSMLRGIAARQNMVGWTEDRWRELRAVYCGMCARTDALLGLLIDAMRQAGVYDNSAIFVFSDHGDFTGDYGLVEKNQNTFQDCLTRVPLIVKPPAGVPVIPGVRDQLVELVDFPATAYELAGIDPGYTHFGRSLLPLLANCGAGRDAVFCEGGRIHGERHCMELESTSSQKPSGLYWPRVNLQTSEGPEHTKAVMCRTAGYKYVRRLYERDELYDLQVDPAELHNRIDAPSLADVARSLRDRMLTFFLETGDVVPHETDKR